VKEIQLSRSNLIICHHQNDYEWFIQNYNTFFTNASNLNPYQYKVIFVNIPHSAEKTIYKDYGLPNIYDVLMVGRTTSKHYPFKNRLVKLIEEKLSKLFKCYILEHPGYNVPDFQNNLKCLNNYAKVINQAKVVLSCTSRYKYALGKLVEIPLCNSLICSDIPDERQDFFKKFIWEINDKMSDEEIVNRITMILNNKSKRKEMTMAGKMLMEANFTQEHYADKFIKTIGRYYGK
jgi:hypothetical protein